MRDAKYQIREVGESRGELDVQKEKCSPVRVVGNKQIRESFDDTCLRQAINSREAPGVTEVVLNPDAHAGYGAPVGCVMISPTHIYPGPVGVDIKCSMSLLQTDLPEEEVKSKEIRMRIINALLERIPTGAGKGQRAVRRGRRVDYLTARKVAIEGATTSVCDLLGIPTGWIERCEDAFHPGHNGQSDALSDRFSHHELIAGEDLLRSKLEQLGSYGGGNHFGEANIVRINEDEKQIADCFGLLNNRVAFLSHCGSRGFGYYLAQEQFRSLQGQFKKEGRAFPGGDKELVYAELGTEEGDRYLDDMALGGNFATVNHLLINTLVLESFAEVFPGIKGELVYFISHNIARKEIVNGRENWVHRKGATRAFPAGHEALKGTKYFDSGHPILLPGNPKAGSVVMVALPEADYSYYSVNHGAGRSMSRSRAKRELSQSDVDKDLERSDIISNCRSYPLDEAPAAYKDFHQVLASVKSAGLAKQVAELSARFVIKDGDSSNGGAA